MWLWKFSNSAFSENGYIQKPWSWKYCILCIMIMYVLPDMWKKRSGPGPTWVRPQGPVHPRPGPGLSKLRSGPPLSRFAHMLFRINFLDDSWSWSKIVSFFLLMDALKLGDYGGDSKWWPDSRGETAEEVGSVAAKGEIIDLFFFNG